MAAQTCAGYVHREHYYRHPGQSKRGRIVRFHCDRPGCRPNFTLTASAYGQDAKAFSPLDPDTDPVVHEWVFDIPVYPSSNKGFWQTDQIGCDSDPNDGTLSYFVEAQPNGGKGPLHVLTTAPNHITTCTWHIHREVVNSQHHDDGGFT